MKKNIFVIVLILLTVAFMSMIGPVSPVVAANKGQSMTNVVSYSATVPKVQVAVGPYTVFAVQQLYNSLTYTTNTTFGLYDSSVTYTATPWKVTITTVPCNGSNDTMPFTQLGWSANSQNGSGIGVLYGVTFSAGVVLDALGSNGFAVTGTAAVVGK